MQRTAWGTSGSVTVASVAAAGVTAPVVLTPRWCTEKVWRASFHSSCATLSDLTPLCTHRYWRDTAYLCHVLTSWQQRWANPVAHYNARSKGISKATGRLHSLVVSSLHTSPNANDSSWTTALYTCMASSRRICATDSLIPPLSSQKIR